MNDTDFYDAKNNDHKFFLAQEARKLEAFTKDELRELSEAMDAHRIRLCELIRAMRSYVQNPFGKYYTRQGGKKWNSEKT